jgi:death on curing protein
METPIFLTVAEVIALHEIQLAEFGGSPGLRDAGLLESAVAMPQSGFGEEYAHCDVFEMAAAYLFHLVKNHPFVDGNKRVGYHAAYVFLRLNQVRLLLSQQAAYDLVIATAEGRASKAYIAQAFRDTARGLTDEAAPSR